MKHEVTVLFGKKIKLVCIELAAYEAMGEGFLSSQVLVTLFPMRNFTEAAKFVGLLIGFSYYALTISLIWYDVSDKCAN